MGLGLGLGLANPNPNVPRSWLPSGPSGVSGDTSPRVRRPSSGSLLTATEGPRSPSAVGGAVAPAAEMELAAVQLLPYP